ncbi:MAG: putative sulfate exporter family transporter [Gordonia sp. (in: high G+C Gram-positive bacteria)]|uniref:YeiH family protein n=1 Tax=Gordonia sp. (in: high G+C Gram-positive bacteria) TaxID=84139 RepID=UPI0039E2981A
MTRTVSRPNPGRPDPAAPIRKAGKSETAARIPGLAVVAAATAAATIGHLLVPAVSPPVFAIVLGVVVGNVRPLGARYAPGLALAARPLLRIGVALLGLQLVFGDVLALGPGVIAAIVVTVAAGLGAILWLGAKLGLSPAQRLLIACGTSICGAAAVAAAESVVDADENETATAVATVVVFGTLLLGVIPAVVGLFTLNPELGGMWAGLAIQEVAQAVAAGGIIGSGALAVAAVVKLGRVLMLAPVLAVLSVRRRRTLSAGARPPLVPFFVIGFLACVALSSTGLVPDPVLTAAGHVQTTLLGAAMFALGTGVRAGAIRAAGPRPFVLGAAGTVWIAVVGLGGALAVGGLHL